VNDIQLITQGDGVTIWRADARALPIADEGVHLIVTSPPYNARVAYDGYSDWLPWQEYWHGLIEPALRECHRVLAHGGRIALNFANVIRADVQDYRSTSSRRGDRDRSRDLTRRTNGKWVPPGAGGEPWAVIVVPRLWALLEEIGFLPREHLVWVKAGLPEDVAPSTAWGSWCSPSNPVLRAVAEPVFIASKGTHTRPAGTSDLSATEFKLWTRNAWSIHAGHRDQYLDHPAMFPLELPRRLIKLYSYVGDTVLDPFMGSGTTLRAAKNLGRVALGVEQSERYCRLAAARCAQSVMPLEMVNA
jgi:site-specific DNA-methyltransferase (adenine-specific)